MRMRYCLISACLVPACVQAPACRRKLNPSHHTSRPSGCSGARRSAVRTSAAAGSDPSTSGSSSGGTGTNSTWEVLREFTRKEFRGLAQSYVATPQQRQRLKENILVSAGLQGYRGGGSMPPAM